MPQICNPIDVLKLNQCTFLSEIIVKIKLILSSKQRFEINIDNESMLPPAEQIRKFMAEEEIDPDDMFALEYESARSYNLDDFDDWYKKKEALANHNLRQLKELMDDEAFEIIPTNALDALKTFYSQYPRNRVWQLAVDGQLYTQITGNSKEQIIKRTDNKGWFDYENREVGSLKAFFWGVNTGLEHIEEQELSLSLINQIHFCVTNAVQGLEGEIIRGGYRNKEANFNIYKDTGRITPEGLEDLLNKIDRGELGSAALFLGSTNPKVKEDALHINRAKITEIKAQLFHEGKIGNRSNLALAEYLISTFPRFRYQAPACSEISKLMEQVIDHYNRNLTQVSTPEERLELIGKTIESFQRIHPYGDANGRVFVNILQNRLLIQHGFAPATFFQPNIYDIYGHHVAVLKRGILNTVIIYNSGNPFGYYMHKENSPEEQAIFLDMEELNAFTAQTFTNPLFTFLNTPDSSRIDEEDILRSLGFTDDILLKLDCIDDVLANINSENSQLIDPINRVYRELIQDIPSPEYNQTSKDFARQELNIQIEKRVRAHIALMETLMSFDEEEEKEPPEVEISKTQISNPNTLLSIDNFIADLNYFIECQPMETSGLVSPASFWGNESQANIEAARKLIKLLQGEDLHEDSLTPINIKSLNSSELGEIIAKYRPLYERAISDVSSKNQHYL